MTPPETLEKIRIRFQNIGLHECDLTVDVAGVIYRISLDPDHFVVYRINKCAGPNHHVPGWPVCLVTKDSIFEECFDDGLSQDHCSCSFTIEQWLEIAKENSDR